MWGLIPKSSFDSYQKVFLLWIYPQFMNWAKSQEKKMFWIGILWVSMIFFTKRDSAKIK